MKIAVSVNISCRHEELFPWIADPNMALRWQRGEKSGQILSETPGKVGTVFREEMEENGKTLVMHGEITESFNTDRYRSVWTAEYIESM